MKNKENFKVSYFDDDDGEVKELELAVMRPSREALQKARLEYSKVFGQSLDARAPLRVTLDRYLRDQKAWDDDKEKEYQALVQRLAEGEKKLTLGGIKLSEGREIAIEMIKTRDEIQELIAERNALDANTAEGQAENARFNCLLACCLVYADTGKPYYKDMDDYLSRSANEVAVMAANKFADFYYGLKSDYEQAFSENQFLRKWGFMNEELRLVNKQGHLINEDGDLVDYSGNLVDEEGNVIDTEGNRIETKDGEWVTQPFLDDDGNPIQEETSEESSDVPEELSDVKE
jgi:hypothetical protein